MAPDTVRGRAGTVRAPLDRSTTPEQFAAVLRRLGYELGEADLARAWDDFHRLAERKQLVTAHELEALLDDRLRAEAEQYQLVRLSIRTTTEQPAWAHVEILERNHEAPAIAEATGDGPVDAAFGAIREALHVAPTLVGFSIDALSAGADALADAHVTIELDGGSYAGEGVAADLTEAAVRAYLRALSHARRSERAGL